MEEKDAQVRSRSRSPEKLLSGFLKGHIVLWILFAVAVHAVLIGMLSLGYIRDRWIDPEGAVTRKAAAEAAKKELQKAAAPEAAKAAAPAATNAAAAQAVKPAVAPTSTTAAATGDQIPEDRKDSPVVKRITEQAKPGEMPKQPAELGISIDDTNPK